jgi:hypothetical protein
MLFYKNGRRKISRCTLVRKNGQENSLHFLNCLHKFTTTKMTFVYDDFEVDLQTTLAFLLFLDF